VTFCHSNSCAASGSKRYLADPKGHWPACNFGPLNDYRPIFEPTVRGLGL